MTRDTMSLTAAADVLGLSYGTIRAYVRKKKLHGDYTAVTVDSVEAVRVQRMSEQERIWETTLQQHAPELLPLGRWNIVFSSERGWKLDWGIEAQQVAVELHGGTWAVDPKTKTRHFRSRHTTRNGFEEDRIKMNAALLAGWRVLEFTTIMLETDPQGCVAQVLAAVHQRPYVNE